MPRREGGKQADATEQVIAQIGLDNLETILASYRRFVDRVDYRALTAWQIRDPLDDLLQPLFLAALVTVTQDLELGDVGRLLAQIQGGETQWAVRRDGPHGSHIDPMPDEDTARCFAATSVNASLGYSNTLMRRLIGPWTEAPDDDH